MARHPDPCCHAGHTILAAPVTLASLLASTCYIRERRVMLGAIWFDLFAVRPGGPGQWGILLASGQWMRLFPSLLQREKPTQE